MNICVVGAGYVGLVTGAVFADLGNEVICVDNVADKIAALQAGCEAESVEVLTTERLRLGFEYHSIGRPSARRS